MTENRRIFWNIIATYGRSLYALVVGLFCGRWALMVLGEVDYGLLGLIGGLAGIIALVNSVLGGAISRFYAVSVGAARVAGDKDSALEECRHWFNTALLVHTVVPVILILVCYPIGIWAVKEFLKIPPNRIAPCVWVFRFVCISTFFGMVSVPFNAMYTAKQYIAELTIYGFVTQTIYVCVMYYMLNHPADWLVEVSLMGCLLAIVPQIIIAIRGCWLFPECRFVWRYLFDRSYLRRVTSYSVWQMVGTVNYVLRTNGFAILINKLFCAAINAAMTIGNTVQSHCNTLASAMQGAFSPAITQAFGAREYNRMKLLALRSCKLSVLMTLVFMIPLALELPEVLRLWLKAPPQHTVGLCWCAMLMYLFWCGTDGHNIVVNATGKIGTFNMTNCCVSLLMLIVATLIGIWFRSLYAVMAVFVAFTALSAVIRALFAKRLAGMPICPWIREVVLKASLAVVVVGGVGLLPRFFMAESFLRVVVTTVFCEASFWPLLWFVLLSKEERLVVYEKVLKKVIHRRAK